VAMPDERLIVLGIGGAAALLSLGIWIGCRITSTCPSCQQAWAKQCLSTTCLDSCREARDHVEYTYIRNSKGEVTNTIATPTVKIVTIKTLQDKYSCKHCGHEWDKIYKQES